MIRQKGLRGGAARDRLHHGRFDFDEALAAELLAQGIIGFDDHDARGRLQTCAQHGLDGPEDGTRTFRPWEKVHHADPPRCARLGHLGQEEHRGGLEIAILQQQQSHFERAGAPGLQIQDDQVWPHSAGHAQDLGGLPGLDHLIALALKKLRKRCAKGCIYHMQE